MLKTILVGLDGSPYSDEAVSLGMSWAKKFNALLVGLAIIDEPSICSPEAVPIGGGIWKKERDKSLISDAFLTAEQLLGNFSVLCEKNEVPSKVLEDTGIPYEKICFEAQRYDLILLGKQTNYHFKTQNYNDETLTKVLMASPRPVVVVPKQSFSGNLVIVAFDGSLQAARTLQAFQSLRLDFMHEVIILSVHTDLVLAIKNASRAVDFLGFHEIKAKPIAIASSDPAKVIIDEANRLKAGLLVMGAYGQSTIREFFFGSVTRTILKEMSWTVFLYH